MERYQYPLMNFSLFSQKVRQLKLSPVVQIDWKVLNMITSEFKTPWWRHKTDLRREQSYEET